MLGVLLKATDIYTTSELVLAQSFLCQTAELDAVTYEVATVFVGCPKPCVAVG